MEAGTRTLSESAILCWSARLGLLLARWTLSALGRSGYLNLPRGTSDAGRACSGCGGPGGCHVPDLRTGADGCYRIGNPIDALGRRGSALGRRGKRLQNALVISGASSLMLLVCAGVLVSSVMRLNLVRVGFNSDRC